MTGPKNESPAALGEAHRAGSKQNHPTKGVSREGTYPIPLAAVYSGTSFSPQKSKAQLTHRALRA